MTIPERIEALKTRLAQSTEPQQQAEILLEILEKYTSINSIESAPYILQLTELAEKLNQPLYSAWALYYSSANYQLSAHFDVAIEKAKKAMELFEKLHYLEGVAKCHSQIGLAYVRKYDFAKAATHQGQCELICKEQNTNSTLKDNYINIALRYEIQGDCQTALDYYKSALDISVALNDQHAIAKSHYQLGKVQTLLSNYTLAVTHLMEAKTMSETLSDDNLSAYIFHQFGSVYHETGKYGDAIKNHMEALHLRQKNGNAYGMAASYNNIAQILDKQKNSKDALKNYSLCLEICEARNDEQGKAIAYTNMASVHARDGNNSEALKMYYKALDAAKSVGYYEGVTFSGLGIGIAYLQLDEYENALKYLQEAVEISLQKGTKYIQGTCLVNLGNAHQKMNRHSEAIAIYQKCLCIVDDIKHKEMELQATCAYYISAKACGNYILALQMHERYHSVNTEILGQENQRQIVQLNFQNNMEQKERQLEIEQLRNVELKKERDRSEALLLNILPAEVAEELKEKGTADAKLFDEVTVLFTDFKSFTTVSEKLTPQELVNELNECFKAFDEIIGKYNIEKIKTVGDAYLAAAGLPSPNQSHADDMINAALEIRDFMVSRKKKLGNSTFEMRVGIHSGSVVAGIVGVKKFAYDIWGDTVNTAARMEQNGVPGKVNISYATYELVKDNFKFEYRGELEAKNKGRLKMYFVER